MTAGVDRNLHGALPAWHARHQVLHTVQSHTITFVVGATGSGKTTQIPRWLDEADGEHLGPVAVAQPRRLAAISVAQRVSQEVGCRLGTRIGYAVRFDDCSHPTQTRVRYATSGWLLREAVADPLFTRYQTLVIDEVHERLVQTDVLIAVARRAAQQRRQTSCKRPLRLVLMSATWDADRWRAHFETVLGAVGVVHVPGRLYPVDVLYTRWPQGDYLDAALNMALQVHEDAGDERGDILVFLTGQEEIETAVRLLPERARRRGLPLSALYTVPLYASLPNARQAEALQRAPDALARKIIFSTNVAETSLTIPNVRYVVDTGVSKQRQYSPRTGADVLAVRRISRAQADQRAGRVGREPPGGVCIRLYPEAEFLKMDAYPQPEICRCDLTGALLDLYALGIEQPWRLEWLDAAPPPASIERALVQLHQLGAVDDALARTSTVGVAMSRLPVAPADARMLLVAAAVAERQRQPAVLTGVLRVAALLAVDALSSGLFTVPPGVRREDAWTHWRGRFGPVGDGDLLCMARVLEAYTEQPAAQRQTWCREHYVQARVLEAAEQAHVQLETVLQRYPVDAGVCAALPVTAAADAIEDVGALARYCICCGYFQHVAYRLTPDGSYRRLLLSDDQRLRVHPSSVMRSMRPPPECVVYHSLVLTRRAYLRGITVCDAEWLKWWEASIPPPNGG